MRPQLSTRSCSGTAAGAQQSPCTLRELSSLCLPQHLHSKLPALLLAQLVLSFLSKKENPHLLHQKHQQPPHSPLHCLSGHPQCGHVCPWQQSSKEQTGFFSFNFFFFPTRTTNKTYKRTQREMHPQLSARISCHPSQLKAYTEADVLL